MTNNEELNEMESGLIEKALKGDLDARLQLEVVIPFSHCIKAAVDKVVEAKGDQAKLDKVFGALAQTIAAQVTLLIGTIAGKDNILQGALIMGGLLERIGEISARSLKRLALSEAARKGRELDKDSKP